MTILLPPESSSSDVATLIKLPEGIRAAVTMPYDSSDLLLLLCSFSSARVHVLCKRLIISRVWHE